MTLAGTRCPGPSPGKYPGVTPPASWSWQWGDPSLGDSRDPPPSATMGCRMTAQHANSYGDLGVPMSHGDSGTLGVLGAACLVRGSWGTLGCQDASRWLLLWDAVPCPPHLSHPTLPCTPSWAPPSDIPAAGMLHPPIAAPAPLVLGGFKPATRSPRPAEPSAARCSSHPAPWGPWGHSCSPRTHSRGRFCKENQRLAFRNNVGVFFLFFFFFLLHKTKPSLGLFQLESGWLPTPGNPTSAGLQLEKRI